MKKENLLKSTAIIVLFSLILMTLSANPATASSEKTTSIRITAVKNIARGIKLSWDKNSGYKAYRVYKRIGTTKWEQVAECTKNTFTVTGLESGVTYYFSVTGVDKKGKENKSKIDTYATKKKFLAAPILIEVKQADNHVFVSWNPVQGAVNYRVLYKHDGKWHREGDTINTGYTINGLETGTYTIIVRCIDKMGKTYTSGYYSDGKTISFVKIVKPTPYLVTSNINQTSSVNILGRYETLKQAKKAVSSEPASTRGQWYIYNTENGKNVMVWPSLKSTDDRVKKAVKWAVAVSKDSRHGYSCEGEQSNDNTRTSLGRWGSKGDYSCSTLAATAYELAGIVNLRSIAKNSKLTCNAGGRIVKNGLNAGNFAAACTKSKKFNDITSIMKSKGCKALKAGDILVTSTGGHVVIYIGNGQIVEAVINELGREYATPRPGDQTGWEIRISSYWSRTYGRAFRAK